MARLIESKGLIEYAEAAKILRKKYPEAEFLLAGFPDDHKDSIDESTIKKNWYDDYVRDDWESIFEEDELPMSTEQKKRHEELDQEIEETTVIINQLKDINQFVEA